MTDPELARRQPERLRADPARVIAQLFVPGHADDNLVETRTTGVVDHILAMSDTDISGVLDDLVHRFGDRHRDLTGAFRHHAERISKRLHSTDGLSDDRLLVLGAAFTQEYAIEGAALCNPSMVRLPGHAASPGASTPFVLSVRQVGEGHRSSIGFRSGTVDAEGVATLDPPTPFSTAATVGPSSLDVSPFHAVAVEKGETQVTEWVLEGLGDRFTRSSLDARLAELMSTTDTRGHVDETAQWMRELAARSYTARFAEDTALGERVLHPSIAVESNGMEDARFVPFVDTDGSLTHHATYTAFDGRHLSQQLLSTVDFATFEISPMVGPAASNKGLALFPRRVAGRYAALSRHDGAGNAIAYSDDLHHWPDAIGLDAHLEVWESVQRGNCGSPLETEHGWLVLTHGVGPMRTYVIGAMLLDLDEPHRVLRRLRRPLLRPLASEQDGYVPNVVYSCGAMLSGGDVVLPYGIGDASIGFAAVDLDDLVGAMEPASRSE
ncbi:MAG: glycoside hydrolase family 130 protein [Acidimicrobiales bacterium]